MAKILLRYNPLLPPGFLYVQYDNARRPHVVSYGYGSQLDALKYACAVSDGMPDIEGRGTLEPAVANLLNPQ